MTADDFTDIVLARTAKINQVLASKAEEYASEDRLHNFKRGAALIGNTPEQICIGFFVKHITSVLDLVNDLAAGRTDSKKVRMYDEKIGDAINYLILLEALIIERLGHENAKIMG